MSKDLIIVRAGTRSLHHTWIDRKATRPWDLLVCPYEEIAPAPAGVNGWLVSSVLRGPKITGLKTLLNEWRGWRDYRYVVLADDDLFAGQETWPRFFERCAHYGAKLAQPALAEGSYFSHMVTVRNTEFVARRVSFVEVMMPCFRADVLAQLLGTLDLSKTGWGWGLDTVWAKQLGYNDMFVIDDAPVLHTRPAHGNLDRELLDRLTAEHAKIVRENKVVWTMKTLSGFLADGSELAQRDETFLYRLFRGYARIFEQYPLRFEETIRTQLAVMEPLRSQA